MGTPNLNLSLPPYNAQNWNTPLNENFAALDAKAGNSENIPLAGADRVLTAAELGNMRINLSGAIGASVINLIFPDNVGGFWVISNNTTSSTGGAIYARTSSYSVNPVKLPVSGSAIIFSDGRNLYSAVSGSEGAYLPLSGGVIDGSLGVNKDLSVSGSGSFKDMVVGGLTKLKDVVIEGTINLALTTVGVGKFVVGNALLTGDQVFGVQGASEFNGDTKIESGDLEITLGSFRVNNNTAVNNLGGATTIPSGASITIKSGGAVVFEDGSRLVTKGTFEPSSISTGDIKSNTGIAVTGAGGVKSGPGGFLGEGPSSFQAAVTYKDTASFEKRAKFSAGLDGGAGATFVDPVITSTAFAALHLVSGNLQKGMLQQNNLNHLGLYNESDPTKCAYLDITTGKWKASGGIATVVDGVEVDIEDEILALRAEVALLKEVVTTLRMATRS